MSQQSDPQFSSIDDVPRGVPLVRSDGMPVAAAYRRFDRSLAKERIDRVWWAETPFPKSVRRDEPDLAWKWVTLLGEVVSQEGNHTNAWVVETADDGAVQGAVLYSPTSRSLLARGEHGETIPAVYVHYLATAPRNRSRLTNPSPGRYRGVGTALMRLAIAHSYFVGGEGRVNLTSVHHPETILWYEDFGFLRMEVETQGRLVFELPPEVAARHLAEMGLK